jgi:hypothetical protein
MNLPVMSMALPAMNSIVYMLIKRHGNLANKGYKGCLDPSCNLIQEKDFQRHIIAKDVFTTQPREPARPNSYESVKCSEQNSIR